MAPPKRERINNTRKNGKERQRPEPKVQEPRKIPVAFDGYTHSPDADGYILRHMSPISYHCSQLQIFIDATDGGPLELGVDDTEFIRTRVVQGKNTFQIERIIPEGSRIKLRLLDGTTATGVWVSWKGIVSA